MKATETADILVPYTDPRLQVVDSKIAKYFMSEWWGPQRISYPGLCRTYPTPSNIDYMLYVYKRHLTAGLGGIYIDDAYIMPNNDPLSDTAVSEDNKLKPVMGLLAMRELIKRTAVLQHQLGINPRLIIVHCTNTFIIPCLAFANITYDWEMNYGAKDFQDRFSLDFVRTESTGLQAGCVGSVLGGIKNFDNLSAKEWHIAEKKLTRTALAMTLPHEIQINAQHSTDVPTIITVRKLMKKFGIADERCIFVPYWNRKQQLIVSGGDFRCSYYCLPGKILAVVSNMGDNAIAQLELQSEKLGPSKNIVFSDLETGKFIDDQTIVIPKHDFRLVLIEKPEM